MSEEKTPHPLQMMEAIVGAFGGAMSIARVQLARERAIRQCLEILEGSPIDDTVHMERIRALLSKP